MVENNNSTAALHNGPLVHREALLQKHLGLGSNLAACSEIAACEIAQGRHGVSERKGRRNDFLSTYAPLWKLKKKNK